MLRRPMARPRLLLALAIAAALDRHAIGRWLKAALKRVRKRGRDHAAT